jgi:hypothetical protein
MPRIESRLLYIAHLKARGIALFEAAREQALEGIVAEWSRGCYHADGVNTSRLKIRNPTYSAMEGQRELFEARRDARQRGRRVYVAPTVPLRSPSVSHLLRCCLGYRYAAGHSAATASDAAR